MYRFEIICIGEQVGILALLSHLVSDAWTFSLIAKEVDYAYKNLAEKTNESEHDSLCYLDCIKAEAEYRLSSKYIKDEEYWKEKYQEKPESSPIV